MFMEREKILHLNNVFILRILVYFYARLDIQKNINQVKKNSKKDGIIASVSSTYIWGVQMDGLSK